MKNNYPSIVAAVLILLPVLGGCAAPASYRGLFQREQEGMTVTERSLLLDTLRVISLLEDYVSALEAGDMEALLACYSPRYSHYEHGLDWRRERIEADYFTAFVRREVSLREISIELVRHRSGHWLRQEDIDWIRSSRGEGRPGRPYRIRFPGDGGHRDLFLGRGRPRGEAGFGEDEVPVRVSFLVDPALDRSLGEVSLRLEVRGYLASGEGAGEFVSTLRERVVFLLEMEEDGWRIVSQF